MKIIVGGYDVYSQGVIVSMLNEPIQFFIEDLIFTVIFADDLKDEASRLTSDQSENKKGLTLTFYNFNSSLGTGNTKLLHLASKKNINYYLNYRVYSLASEIGKTLQYTWFTKKI